MAFSGTESVATKNRKEKQAEIERLHEKTFKAWINAQLRVRNLKIEGELKDDLKDGLVLINLMEILSGEKCPEKYNTKITLDMHRIENTTIAINFITKHVGKLSVASNDIQQGNMRIILGMIWRIILTFKVERRGDGDDDKELSAAQRNRAAKKKLLDWCVDKTKDHKGVDIKDFGESWYDGLGFCALIHAFDPSLIDYDSLSAENKQANLERAFDLAEKHLDIPRLLDPADICAEDEMSRPDDQCFMTYLSEFPIAFLAGKEKADSRAAEEAEVKRLAQLEAERKAAEVERLLFVADKKRLEEEKQVAEEEARKRKEELEAQALAFKQLEEEKRRQEEEAEEKRKKREEKKKRRHREAEEAEERAKRETEEASRLAREDAEREVKEKLEEAEKRQSEEDAKRIEELAKREAEHEAERLRLEEECRRLKAQLDATKGKLIGKLKVTVVEGRGIAKKDSAAGKADPYCILFLERQKEKTRTIKKSANPKWDADFEFYVSDPEAALEVTIFDWNRIFSDSFLGKIAIPVSGLNDGEETTAWYKLEGKKAKDKVCGELCLRILYNKQG